jgi:hypothetical protein
MCAPGNQEKTCDSQCEQASWSGLVRLWFARVHVQVFKGRADRARADEQSYLSEMDRHTPSQRIHHLCWSN